MPKGSRDSDYRKKDLVYAKSLRIRAPGRTGSGFRILNKQAISGDYAHLAKQAIAVTHESSNKRGKSDKIKKGSYRDYDSRISEATIGRLIAGERKKRKDKAQRKPGSTHKKTS